MKNKNYLFGYGSLILKESRNRTGISGEVYPSILKNYQRFFGDKHQEEIYLAVKENPSAECNGVLVEIPEEELKKFDKREGESLRIKLNPKNISLKENKKLPKGKYWVYVPKKIVLPSKDFPIVQSYIDVVLTGCFELGKNFAEEFMNTTKGWAFIENDREKPKYPRNLKELSYKKEIDNLIRKK